MAVENKVIWLQIITARERDDRESVSKRNCWKKGHMVRNYPNKRNYRVGENAKARTEKRRWNKYPRKRGISDDKNKVKLSTIKGRRIAKVFELLSVEEKLTCVVMIGKCSMRVPTDIGSEISVLNTLKRKRLRMDGTWIKPWNV